MIRQSLMAS